MVTWQLSEEDGRFLHTQLERYVGEMQRELVHSDKSDFRRALHAETDRLRALTDALGGLVARPTTPR